MVRSVHQGTPVPLEMSTRCPILYQRRSALPWVLFLSFFLSYKWTQGDYSNINGSVTDMTIQSWFTARCREAAADRPPPPWMPIDQRSSRSPRYCHWVWAGWRATKTAFLFLLSFSWIAHVKIGMPGVARDRIYHDLMKFGGNKKGFFLYGRKEAI